MTTPQLDPFNPPPGVEGHYVQGNDAMNLMIDIWLSGFASGASSTLATLLGDQPEEVRDKFCHSLAKGISDDPLALEALRIEITELIVGADTGPKEFTVPYPRKSDRQ